MKAHSIFVVIAILLAVTSAWAFPPSPYHEIYGTLRDEQGTPLGSGEVRLNSEGALILAAPVDLALGDGVNYSLKVPMDSSVSGDAYQDDALSVNAPFTISVEIDSIIYVPIEVNGSVLNLGEAGGRTRLDLTLGVDLDGDGLPDSWEQTVVSVIDPSLTIEDIDPDGDIDKDGVSNYDEYIAGTYAFDKRSSFTLRVIEVKNGFAKLRFLSAPGRTYVVKSSQDLQNFETVQFSIRSDGSLPGEAYVASQVKFQDVYVPVNPTEDPVVLYKLYVQ